MRLGPLDRVAVAEHVEETGGHMDVEIAGKLVANARESASIDPFGPSAIAMKTGTDGWV